jgi:tetratricopeptide (TPR) repeat protein
MVMRGSVSRRSLALRRLLALGLVIVLPACSAVGLRSAGDAQSLTDGATIGSSMTVGASGAGNFLAGRFAQDQHDLPAASDYLLQALAGNPENVELLQRASLSLAAEGKLDQAAALSRRLLTFDGEAGIAALLVAEQEVKLGNWAAAEAAVANLPRRGLNSFMVPLVLAWAKVGEGKTDAALDALAPLSQVSSFAALHDFHAALINDLADRRKAADQAYRGTMAGNGGLTLRTVEAASAFYRRIGQSERATEMFDRYRKEHPDTAALDSGATPTRLIDSPQAGLAEVMFGAAGSLRQSNSPDLALIFARMAVDLQPNFPLAQVTVADILQGLGRLPDANAIYAKIDPASPVYFAAQLRLAANLDELGDVEGSIKTLEALAAQTPTRADALITLGDVLRQHKRWAEAVTAYDRAFAVIGVDDRNQWTLHYSRGIALERSKQWTRAETDFLRALELEPDQPHVLNYLGYSWIEQGVNLDQARKMIEKAVQQRPTDGYIVDSLGWVLYRAGDYRKAVTVLEKAIELHPEDSTINDHFGDALLKVGRVAEARFQWQRALTFGPEPDLKVEIERKLKATPAPPPPVLPVLKATGAK